jgi:dihydrolipoamide dehydrogenase
MVIIGAGAIGMEFAYFYNALGTDVTIVEMLENVLPIEDAEVSKTVLRSFKKKKIKVFCQHAVQSVTPTASGVDVVVKDKKGEEKTFSGDVALMAIGVRGNIENLGLEDIGVECERSFIKVGAGYRTSVEGVYAIGDVIGPPLLAHVASHEGILCVNAIAGLESKPMNYDAIPGCTFCHPQVGSIGLSEAECKKRGIKVKVGKFQFIGVGKAVAAGERDGFVKLVFDAKSGKLLGGHIVGPEASELVGELEVAAAAGLTSRDIGHAVHSHPTLHEAVMEAALDADGAAIHV